MIMLRFNQEKKFDQVKLKQYNLHIKISLVITFPCFTLIKIAEKITCRLFTLQFKRIKDIGIKISTVLVGTA